MIITWKDGCPLKAPDAWLQEGFNKKAALSFFKITQPAESQAAPTKCYPQRNMKSEDYELK